MIQRADRAAVVSVLGAAVMACAGERADRVADSLRVADSVAAAENGPDCQYLVREWNCNAGAGNRITVVMRLDTADTTGSNPLRTLEVRPIRGNVISHSLDVGGETMGSISGNEITMHDLDGDGFGDLLLQFPYGHPNNTVQAIWRYQPAA